MPDFLLEIGVEEIPARMMDAAADELASKVEFLLVGQMLHSGGRDFAEKLVTPRRLAVLVRGIEEKQRDAQEEVIGPAYEIGFKDGKPTPAALGFAKKTNVPIEQFIENAKTAAKGAKMSTLVSKPGRQAAQVLSELLPKEITSIYWAKNMYWRSGKPERFVRPVRWIVAMLDSEIIPLEFAGIKAGNWSRGHRILGPAQIAVSSPSQYTEMLQEAHVLTLRSDREHMIRKALDAATRTVSGARWREDAELLKTVVNLTEWPSAILGNFDQQFLSLPEEVLVTVMRDHQ
ncbi:MAG TPA: glycine--tRNA ligase subunit beta, partial [Candidatus Angelobacter sp.]|nr:glycine--tRNA ligase subunit beta [Candidatus Angelobacter sp.]